MRASLALPFCGLDVLVAVHWLEAEASLCRRRWRRGGLINLDENSSVWRGVAAEECWTPMYIRRLSLLGLAAAVIECIGTRPTNIGHWTLDTLEHRIQPRKTRYTAVSENYFRSSFSCTTAAWLAASLKSYCAHLTKANIGQTAGTISHILAD